MATCRSRHPFRIAAAVTIGGQIPNHKTNLRRVLRQRPAARVRVLGITLALLPGNNTP
jgi:hypothetical protein